MPIYDYLCLNCNKEFEGFQKIDDPIPPCPICAKKDVDKLFSIFGFRLKGDGFYKRSSIPDYE